MSRRTGVTVPTLRAWERRYRLLDPERTEGGHRLYRETDVERVRSMSRLLGGGWSAAAAAREVLLPVLRHLGDGWQDDPRVIAREHFATNALRPRLQRLLRTAAHASGGSVLAAAPESEEHDLGLLAAAADTARLPGAVVHDGPMRSLPESLSWAVTARGTVSG